MFAGRHRNNASDCDDRTNGAVQIVYLSIQEGIAVNLDISDYVTIRETAFSTEFPDHQNLVLSGAR